MRKYARSLLAGIFVLFSGFSCNSQNEKEEGKEMNATDPANLKIFLCGDVMSGRGIDQALPQSVDPILYESYIKNARDYLKLAERASGNIDIPFSYDYIWGEALDVWKENSPQFKLINLETSITTHSEPWPGKGINYRMHPENVKILTTAGIDHCSLANNHTLDWGRPGLEETMITLETAGIAFSGVGKNEKEAKEPSVVEIKRGRLLIFSYGTPSSGVPGMWAAEPGLSGVNFLPGLNETQLNDIKSNVLTRKTPGDIAIFSVHWGGNWGYSISERQQDFAHRLIDEAGIDVVFGHSSHHPMGIEVYKGKLILYGAGDFINDYEGISGHREFRPELTLMYFPELEPATGRLKALKLVPMEIKKFRLNRAVPEDAQWLKRMLDREGGKLGTKVKMDEENNLWLEW